MSDDKEMVTFARGYMAGYEAAQANGAARPRVIAPYEANDLIAFSATRAPKRKKRRKLSAAHKAAIMAGKRKAALGRKRAARK